MSSRHNISPELRALIDELLNGTISADGVQRLELSLDENRVAQQFFRDYCQLHINLDAEMRAQRVVNDFKDRNAAGPPAAPAAIVPLPIADSPATEAPQSPSALGFIADCLKTGADFMSRPVGFVSAAVGLSALLVVVVIAIGGRVDWDFGPQKLEVAAGDTGKGFDRGRVNSVRLETGITKLTLDKIGTVIVEGPSDFELIGPMRARLTRGRIRMHVTEPTGRGFVVETPNGEVTDLGTEFGVDVSSELDTGVVVFQGSVDLAVPKHHAERDEPRVERLVQGEGLCINGAGQVGRIMSIVTGGVATFRSSNASADASADRVIAHVADNIVEPNVRKFYEIVAGGMREDALTYVDRPAHEWNGLNERGMPSYLIGADYVKTFCEDKVRKDMEISVTLNRPARLFILFDHRVAPPDWLTRDFRPTGDNLGLDLGPCVLDGVLNGWQNEVGPGRSLDERFSIWERVVEVPGLVVLGPDSAPTYFAGMYGIAAKAIELAKPRRSTAADGVQHQENGEGHSLEGSRINEQ